MVAGMEAGMEAGIWKQVCRRVGAGKGRVKGMCAKRLDAWCAACLLWRDAGSWGRWMRAPVRFRVRMEVGVNAAHKSQQASGPTAHAGHTT